MQTDFSQNKETVVFGDDSVVIRKFNAGFHGGRTLDCKDFPLDVIRAGHVIIKDAEGVYKPMPITGEGTEAAYAALPEGATYVGVLYRSLSVKLPAASIMFDGIVNPEIIPYSMDAILDAFKAACPHIIFDKDEEA